MPGVTLLKNVTALSYNVAKKTLLAAPNIIKYQSAGMILTSLRDPEFVRPPAFPYKEKKYTLLDQLFDRVIWRFNENSKVVVVEGPPASGKSKVVKDIADAYDLHIIPALDLDEHYINDFGFDNRKMNPDIPFACRSFDIHEFLQNPHDPRAIQMHLLIYKMRLLKYVEALAHILNTGQGVVMERSVYVDKVFADTFTQCGFYPKNFDVYMKRCYLAIFDELLKPHVVVYLDQSVDVTIKRIKERNLPGEDNSPVYTKKVLNLFEKNYKTYLKQNVHSEVMVYDWNEERDSQMIIEDLETVNLDDYAVTHPKMRDWRTDHFELFWIDRRSLFTNGADYFSNLSFIIDLCCPEVFLSGGDLAIFDDVYFTYPGNEFAKGYNYLQGEPFPYWK